MSGVYSFVALIVIVIALAINRTTFNRILGISEHTAQFLTVSGLSLRFDYAYVGSN